MELGKPYEFNIKMKEGSERTDYVFKIPDPEQQEISIINGGDIGSGPASVKLNSILRGDGNF